MTRNRIALASLFLIALIIAAPAEAQVMRHSSADGGDLVIFQEIGVVVGLREGTTDLEVLTMLPNAPATDVTVERGDLLLMVAGKRVRDVASLRDAYEGTEVGETLKLGFRRGNERFLVSFDKQDQPEGQTRMVMMGGPEGGGDVQPLMEFGVVLREADGQVVVGMELPMNEAGLAQDDVIRSVNGQAIESLTAFREIYEATSIGDELELVFARGNDEKSVTRARQEATGAIRMKTAP